MIDEALLRKLRSIKAFADDGKSEHECQTALLMFQKLLKKYGLSEKDVPIEDAQPEGIKEEKSTVRGASHYGCGICIAALQSISVAYPSAPPMGATTH